MAGIVRQKPECAAVGSDGHRINRAIFLPVATHRRYDGAHGDHRQTQYPLHRESLGPRPLSRRRGIGRDPAAGPLYSRGLEAQGQTGCVCLSRFGGPARGHHRDAVGDGRRVCVFEGSQRESEHRGVPGLGAGQGSVVAIPRTGIPRSCQRLGDCPCLSGREDKSNCKPHG